MLQIAILDNIYKYTNVYIYVFITDLMLKKFRESKGINEVWAVQHVRII